MRPSLPVFCLLLCLSLSALAQESSGMSAALYQSLKTVTIDNLERDTYVISDGAGVILDRYELKPAYVFNFSDGIERKVYLYLVYPLETEDTLGCLMIYQREDALIHLPLPGPDAAKETWGLYIDDLKYTGEEEPGFLACIGFVVSREFATLLSGSFTGTEEEGEYEYCFPAGSSVMLADQTIANIEDLQLGDQLLGWDLHSRQFTSVGLEGMDIHRREGIPLVRLLYLEPQTDLAILPEHLPASQVSLTPNHPIYSDHGILRAEDVQPGMHIFLNNGFTIASCIVLGIEPGAGVNEVYSLHTNGQPFFVEGVMVSPK